MRSDLHPDCRLRARPSSPVSPDPSVAPEAGAAPDGSTLKSATPAPVSPINGAQVTDTILFTASKSTGKFMDIALSYRFQVRSGSTVVYDSGAVGGVGAGASVTHSPTAQLAPETIFTWRVRAEYQGAFGSWSPDAAFKSPVGAYIRGSEIRDPLTIGRTVGTPAGPVQFVKDGIELLSAESRVTYVLPQTLQAGEFSLWSPVSTKARPATRLFPARWHAKHPRPGQCGSRCCPVVRSSMVVS